MPRPRSYQQPSKNRVRQRIFEHAVSALTQKRDQSAIVKSDELAALVEYAIGVLAQVGLGGIGPAIRTEFEDWQVFRESRSIQKMPADLRVVYLCGPEPLNDLRVLMGLGVNPHNIWAVESNDKFFRQAIRAVDKARIPLKIHHGSLAHFFAQVNETFDIAYLDNTRPILGSRPQTLAPLIELLSSGRLSPISALITNFSQIPESEADRYARAMTSFYRFRYDDVPEALHNAGVDPAIAEHEPASMYQAIAANLESTHSEFITRLIVDISRSWIPVARAFRVVEDDYLAEGSERKAILCVFRPIVIT